MIAVIANKNVGHLGDSTVLMGESLSNEKGEFRIQIPITDELYGLRLIARKQDSALHIIKLDFKSLEDTYTVELKPSQPLRIRLVGLEGQPAGHLTLDWYDFHNLSTRAAAAPPQLETDANGYITIEHVAVGQGVLLKTDGDNRFAPQLLSINTGEPEERPERNATYRALVKKVPADKTVTIALSPAQPFTGQVFLADSDQPAVNAPISIWSSQQPEIGSMVTLFSMTDGQGRFRLNPYPGVRFGIEAYPPKDSPYQSVRLRDLRWTSDENTSAMRIRLPKGVFAEGQVTNEVTGEPIPDVYVQYMADSKNPNYTSGFIQGWQAMVRTDAEGRFRVTALPESGTLIAHAGELKPFVMKSMGSREVELGKPGGTRYYAHAFEKIELDPTASASQSFAIKLQPSVPLSLKIVDPEGQPIAKAVYTTVLVGSPYHLFFRGDAKGFVSGQETIHGLAAGDERRIDIWCEDRKMGASAMLVGGEKLQTIVLHPAGSVKMRLVEASGKPHADQPTNRFSSLHFVMADGRHPSDTKDSGSELSSDMDFYTNFNRSGQNKEPQTDGNGRVTLLDLIPGAKYQFQFPLAGKATAKEFSVEPGQELDLGEIVTDGPEADR